MQEFTQFANILADQAGEIARHYFRTGFDIETKSDETPVTIADREIERVMREAIEVQYPDHGILGEEFGEKSSKDGYQWILDPIDGTKSFIVGRPTFGTLIALWKNDKPILGIIDQPILKERWVGSKNETIFNGSVIQTRECSDIQDAILASTSPSMMRDLWPKLYDASKTMIWGGDCYSYGLLANGFLDCVIERQMNVYDYAALINVVEGAGGIVSDWKGNALKPDSDGSVLACGDARLHAQMLKLLQKPL